MKNHAVILAALLMFLSSAVILADGSDAADRVVKGIGLEEYGQPEYTMDAIYYEGDYLSMEFTCSIPPYVPGDEEHKSSEIGRAVSLVLKNAEDDSVIRMTSSPINMEEELNYELLYGAEGIPDGMYKLEVLNSTLNLVVGCYLYVGEVHEIEFKDTEDWGSIEPNDPLIVPHNTEMVLEDVTVEGVVYEDAKMIFTYSGHEFADATAKPPEGFMFAGWFSNDIKIDSGDKVTEDKIEEKAIEARWSCEYTLHFDANGGSGAPEDLVYVGSETSHTFTIPATRPYKSGEAFIGWSETPSGQPSYMPGASYTLEYAEPEATLYAVWQPDVPPVPPGPTGHTYKLIYDANGGEGAPDPKVVKTNAKTYTFTVTSETPEWDGFTFKGWATSSAGEAEYSAGDRITLSSTSPNLTLFAAWVPSESDITDIYADVDALTLGIGKSVSVPVTTEPEGKESMLIYSSSNTGVATVSPDGRVTAVGNGTAVITISSPDGKVSTTVSVTVSAQPSEHEGSKTMTSDDGGRVVLYYDSDSSGDMMPVNPIHVYPGADGISYQIVGYAEWCIDELSSFGIDTKVLVHTADQRVTVPAGMLSDIVMSDGILSIQFFEEVTLTFSADVLEEIGTDEDIELVVIPVLMESTDASEEIDVSELGDDVKVYDIYVLKNGKRVSMTLSYGVDVAVVYPLEDGQTVDRIHVYYVDVKPFEEYSFKYADGSVDFTVHHFSHYAISYDTEKKSSGMDPILLVGCIGGGILLLLLVLFLFLFVLRKKIRLDLDGGTYVFVPEGWKSESSSVIYRRFRKGEEFVIPKVDARFNGNTVVGWLPDPPEKVEKSETFKAVWSNQNDL